MLEPMGGIGEGEKIGARAVSQTFVRHFGEEEIVALAPEDAGGYAHGFVWKLDAKTEERAVPVDHGNDGMGLGPCGAVLSEIFRSKGPWAAGTKKRTRADAEVEGGE